MARKLSLLTLILFLGLSFSANAQGIVTGKFSAGSSSDGYNLHKGKGDRIYSYEVTFDKPFEVKPEIILTVSQVDASTESNLRYSVSPSSVTRDGFVIKIKTWSDSKLYGIKGNWIALPKK